MKNKIPATSVTYGFNEQGDIINAGVQFQSYNSQHNYNAKVTLTDADLEDGQTIENLGVKGLEEVSRQKLSEWILVEKNS
ncbi:hypothetical protein ACODH8_09945 [Vagococcus fluvialis]|uniref:hypothetical protein n=1 Tax=Vagococcus fluvialis TaxID=2738 RepID=UPI003B5B041E